MDARASALAEHLLLIERELRVQGWWQEEAPSAEAGRPSADAIAVGERAEAVAAADDAAAGDALFRRRCEGLGALSRASMRSLFLFVCVTRSTGYWPDLRSPLVERPTPAAAACMSRRDWAQRALGFAAVAGAALPARADEIDDAFSRILSSAAEEMGQFDAGSDGQRKVAERTLEKLRAATVLQVQQEAAPAVSAPVGIAPTEAVFGANTMGETSAFSTAAPPGGCTGGALFRRLSEHVGSKCEHLRTGAGACGYHAGGNCAGRACARGGRGAGRGGAGARGDCGGEAAAAAAEQRSRSIHDPRITQLHSSTAPQLLHLHWRHGQAAGAPHIPSTAR